MAKIATDSKKNTTSKALKTGTTGERREIERLAYQFFVERGCQHGYDAEDWLKAEAIVRSRRS